MNAPTNQAKEQTGTAKYEADGPGFETDEETCATVLLSEMSNATRVANENLAQQNAISYQQSVYQMCLTSIGKSFEMITHLDAGDPQYRTCVESYSNLIQQFSNLAQKAGDMAMGLASETEQPEVAEEEKGQVIFAQ